MKTVSIWTDVMDNIGLYKNTLYSREDSNKALYPNFSLYKIRFWEEYFLKYNLGYKKTVKKSQSNNHLKTKFDFFNLVISLRIT